MSTLAKALAWIDAHPRLDPAREELVLAALVLAGLAALAAFLFSRGIARPLARLAAAARRVGSHAPLTTATGSSIDDTFAELRRASNARGPPRKTFPGILGNQIKR